MKKASPKKRMTKTAQKPQGFFARIPRRIWRWIVAYYRQNVWHKLWCIFLIIAGLCLSGSYGLARWYMAKHANTPIEFGATFIPGYARYFGLEPQETMTAMIDDLGIKRLRLVSYWSIGEPVRGQYDFSELDWQMRLAEDRGVRVTLSIGLRQPRWPECHMPTWASVLPKGDWEPELMDYIEAVVERYKTSPALESWQLENEFFLKVFGECPDHSRDRLVAEYNLVKRLDPNRTVVVSMSNNAIGMPIGEPTPDMWAISVYKRVWDKNWTRGRYFEYPIPAWYYAFRAGVTEIVRGRNSFIHELQAESWTPGDLGSRDTPLEEQYKSMNAERLHHRMEYGRATGMKKIDLWGVEWWYFLKAKKNDPSIWEAAKSELQKTEQHNAQLKQ